VKSFLTALFRYAPKHRQRTLKVENSGAV